MLARARYDEYGPALPSPQAASTLTPGTGPCPKNLAFAFQTFVYRALNVIGDSRHWPCLSNLRQDQWAKNLRATSNDLTRFVCRQGGPCYGRPHFISSKAIARAVLDRSRSVRDSRETESVITKRCGFVCFY